MICKRLPLRFTVPAFLSKLLYSELKSDHENNSKNTFV